MVYDALRLYRLMFSSRRLEEEIARLWREGVISGEMHLGIGEEGIVAGVVDHLSVGDGIAADHRSTPPLAMRGVDQAAIIAECIGAVGGLGRGMGGHMHLLSQEFLAASSGIVGSSGPLACGFGLAHQHLAPDRVAVAFFGEGALNQGMLMESLNLAACWELPVLFVCKDNGMAITTPSKRVTSGNLPDRVRGFGIPAVEVDGAEVQAVWQAAGEMILKARRGGGPGYIHASCVRPEGHFLGDPLRRIVRKPVEELKDKVGPLTRAVTRTKGARIGKRTASLMGITGMIARAAGMRGRDPVSRLRSRLSEHGSEVSKIEAQVEQEIRAAVESALASLEEVPA